MTSTALVPMEQARALLEEARTVDEIKDVRDKGEALRLYAKQAGYSLDIQNQCAEIKLRAERKAGELLAVMEKHPGGRATGSTLQQVGVTRTQSSRWQQIAALPDPVFEEHIASTRSAGLELTSSGVRKLAGQHRRREEVAAAPRRAAMPLTSIGPFDVLYVDPPWQYADRSTKPNRQVENHYSTMSLEELAALELPAADNSVLLMWATSPKLADAIDLMRGWDFSYRTCMVWVKDRMGLGYWVRQQHELLLIGRRGNAAHPPENARPRSVITAPRGAHSAKPAEVYGLIEQMFPGRTLCELFARTTRPGWTSWGDGVPASEPVGVAVAE